VSEHGDQFEEREEEGPGDAPGSEQDGGLSSPGGTSGTPSEGDGRKEGTQQSNHESGTDESGAQQGDVAHEGDLPTKGVPEAD